MVKKLIITGIIILLACKMYSQEQGFFLDQWQPATIAAPSYSEVNQTSNPATVSVTILAQDTITKISQYLFGDNANLWTGTMSDNATLMQYLADRKMGVLRGPAGSISDIFFWNYSDENPPTDIPPNLAGQTDEFKPWYGVKPYSWQNWTMATDSFYKILEYSQVTGMLTVNYGYARYGTSANPVAAAAHMAANWVRYDNGRTKFWEIGNEVFGSWEAGYRIDRTLNQDGQPEYITPSLYATHCNVFIDSMKNAAAQIGKEIYIGLVMCDNGNCGFSDWNQKVAEIAGDNADFYVVHSYFTPYNSNSSVATILNSYSVVENIRNYVNNEVDKVGKPRLPIALTEYNIFAVGSKQAVSHVNGMHAVLVVGESMKQKMGTACRWDLANGWSNGDDMGMFSYGNEPGVSVYAPRPAFYHLYFMRKFTGDVLLNHESKGSSDVRIYPTAFSSGQLAVSIVNKSKSLQTIRLNVKDFKAGERYYYYTLTGEEGVDFSRKVWVNGTGTNLVAGGPFNYKDIPAISSIIDKEIKIDLPPLSSTFVLADAGDKELETNDSVYGIEEQYRSQVNITPNPVNNYILITGIPDGFNTISVIDILGKTIIESTVQSDGNIISAETLKPDIYMLLFRGNGHSFVKKFVKQ